MSLDGGYIGSIDHAIANLHLGRNQGRQLGIEEGLEEGYQLGHRDGYSVGWDDGVAAGNVEILKQMEFTRQHIAEKEHIKAELVQQRELIKKLEAKVIALEQENTALRGENEKLRKGDTSLHELINALKSANQRLRDQVMDLDVQFQERTKQYADQVWQYNRSLTFMNAVRGVLEDLINERPAQTDHIRQLFAEKYAYQVSKGLKDGLIKAAPEHEDAFAKALPNTRKFIVEMLNAVGKQPEIASATEEGWIL